MLPKNNRADKKAIETIFKEGIFVRSVFLNFKYINKKNSNPPQISFIVPKSVEKQAVKRNYLRRCGYSSLKKYFNKIPNGLVGVFVFNKTKGNISTLVDQEIVFILKKLNYSKNK